MSDGSLRLLPQNPDRFADLRALDTPLQKPAQPDGPMILDLPQEPKDRFADLRGIDDQRRGQAEKVAIESFDLAAQHDPKVRGEAQQIARDLGLDVDSATRNIAVFREQARRKAVQDRRMMAENPVLARQLQNIEFAAVARRDIDNLTAFEQFGYAWQRGALQVERGRIGERFRQFGEGEQDARRLAQIDRLMLQLPEPDTLLSGAGEVLGQMGQTLPRAVAEGAVAGAVTMGATTLMHVGPQAPVSAPASFFAGFTAAATTRMAIDAYTVEAGNAFIDMQAMGLDRQRASDAALGVGIVNALLETAGAGLATKAARRALTRELSQTVADALAKPTTAKAAGRFALDYAEGVGGEVLTETMQELSSIVGEEVAGADQFGTPEGRAKMVQRVGEIIAKTTQGMALLGIPGPAMALHQNMQDVRESQHAQQLFLALAKNAADSQTRANNPRAYEEHVADEIAKNTPSATTTYIAPQQFAEVLAQAEKAAAGGMSPTAQLRQQMPDVMDQAAAAVASGDDVAIPTSKYATYIAHSEIGKALLPHVRFSPDGISLAEAEAIEETASDEAGKSMDEEQKDAEQWDAEAQEVEKDLFDQLIATGRMQRREAGRLAAFWRAAVETQAERVGETPAAFAAKYPLTVTKQEVPAQDLGKDQGVRGGFDPSRWRISLTDSSDASTFLHEAGHAMLTMLADMAAQKAHPTVVDDFAAFLRWAGVDSAEAWQAMSLDQQRKAHENFAANFEDYLFTGAAPAPGLRNLFRQFAEWLRRVYRTIRDQLNAAHREQFGEDLLPLSPEIRAVMDRMLASDNQVRATQAIRGAVPAFQTKEEAGMDDAQWGAYQQQQREADEAAIDELTRASLRDMRWLGRAKAGMLREIQQKEAHTREGVRQEVAVEMQAQPVYRVQRWLKTGEVVNDDGTKTQAGGEHKIRTESVPEEHRDALRGMTKQDGMDPDTVASMFGFESGIGMVEAIAAAPPLEEAIESATDARMLKEHAELSDSRRVQDRIERALHNETRRRFVASELRALGRSQEPMRVTLAAAKIAAEAALSKKRVRDLSNRQAFTLAARRASKEAQEALGKSGGVGPAATLAFQAKRRQLVQEFMADMAHDARREVEKTVTQFDKFDVTDAKAAKSRDVDIVHAGRALAAAYRLGAPVQTQQEREQQAAGIAKLQAEHPELHARLQPLLAAASRASIDYRDLTLAEFREVGAVAEWLWEQSRANKMIDAAGKKIEKEAAVDDLLGGIGALPPRTPGTPGETPSPGHRDMLRAWSSFASLKRAEHWARWMDGGKDGGPFQRFFVAPIQRAVQAYRAAQKELVTRYADRITNLQEASGNLWHARIEAAEIGFTFRGKKELIGALLHIGNESNLQRLLLNRFGKDGRAWGEIREDGTFDSSRWDAFVRRAFDAGLISRQDIAFIRDTWADYAKLLPQAQKAHRAMLGFEFETVPLRPVETPYGQLEGGYAPAIADPDEMPPRADIDAEASIDGVTRDGLFSLPTNKNFTLNRSDNPNTGRPLALDLGKQLAAFDQELKFIHLMPAVKDALRLIRDPRFKAALGAYDREAIPKILLPYLDNVARQTTVRSTGDRFMDWAMAAWRNATSVAALGWNLINAAIQVTGLSNSLTQVRGRFMLDGVRHWSSSPGRAWQEAAQRSQFMAQRLDQSVRKMRDQVANAVDDGMLAGVRATQRTVGRWAFVLQRGVQSAVDLSTWHGGYAQAIGEGKSDADAVEFADGAVRRSQGSQNPEDAAAYESTAIGRIVGQFGSYGNLVGNTVFFAKGKGGALLWAMFVPIIAEGIIRTALLGGPDDKDRDEDDAVEEWAKVFGKNAVRNVAGLIPGGAMLASLAESEGSRVQVPGMTALAQFARGAFEAIEAAGGEGETTEGEINAIMSMLSIATGMPVAAPVRYVQQVAR